MADGARSAGGTVDVKRVPETVPETVPEDIARTAHFKLDQLALVATIADFERYDAIIVSTGSRFGRLKSQMAAFLDQAELDGARYQGRRVAEVVAKVFG